MRKTLFYLSQVKLPKARVVHKRIDNLASFYFDVLSVWQSIADLVIFSRHRCFHHKVTKLINYVFEFQATMKSNNTLFEWLWQVFYRSFELLATFFLNILLHHSMQCRPAESHSLVVNAIAIFNDSAMRKTMT